MSETSDANKSQNATVSEFFEEVAPCKLTKISDMARYQSITTGALHLPEITLYCESEKCQGLRLHRAITDAPLLREESHKDVFIEYQCKTVV